MAEPRLLSRQFHESVNELVAMLRQQLFRRASGYVSEILRRVVRHKRQPQKNFLAILRFTATIVIDLAEGPRKRFLFGLVAAIMVYVSRRDPIDLQFIYQVVFHCRHQRTTLSGSVKVDPRQEPGVGRYFARIISG
jgi:hypothetical protein